MDVTTRVIIRTQLYALIGDLRLRKAFIEGKGRLDLAEELQKLIEFSEDGLKGFLELEKEVRFYQKKCFNLEIEFQKLTKENEGLKRINKNLEEGL